MKTLNKIIRLPSGQGRAGFPNNERFEVLFSGNHPDERSNQEWIKIMKEKGFKNIDKQMRK